MKKGAFRKWALVPMMLVLLVLGCGHSAGSEYLGKWVNKTNPNDRIEITRNGDQFLLGSGNGPKMAAVYKDGSLQISTALGNASITYVKDSDTLLAPGMFGQSEYQRVKGD